MKFYGFLLAIFFLSSTTVFSQEKSIKHTVSKGETISKIAKQYQVTINEIFELNPNAKKGLQIKDVLLIPNKNQKKQNPIAEITPDSNTIIHKVLNKETIYGLTKKYQISADELYQLNPTLAQTGLKVNQEIKIPSQNYKKEEPILAVNSIPNREVAIEVPNPIVIEKKLEEIKVDENLVIHEVQRKETKYRIAKEYGISVTDLENQNPDVKKNLPIGYKLNIRTSKYIAPKIEVKNEDVALNETSNEIVKPLDNEDLADKLISSASENLGTHYRSGGTTKQGFDCSGLMYSTFGLYNIKLPRSSYEQAEYGFEVKPENAQKGDLIFFKTTKRRQISHVGLVVEVKDGEIKFIHSSTSSGVMISSTKEQYYATRVSQINRVL